MQLKHIDLIDGPIFGLMIADICFLFNIFDLMTLALLIKKIGNKFSFPNGPNLLISDQNLLLIAEKDISES